MNQESFDLVPTALAVKAMRDSGYRNTAYAVAELIDNSLQAGASSVELLCCERQVFNHQRTRRNIHQIAVLDNGVGMSPATLRMALQFGNGMYLDDREGIGRFGMGLPSSSISQCRRVDVWTWQNGPSQSIHSYIDLDEVADGRLREVPAPEQKPIPLPWKMAGGEFSESGTLVVWSILDRCVWKTAMTIIKNSEQLIGRMYRRFISDGAASIRLASFLEDSPKQFEIDRIAQANDPIYLIAPSSTPAPYDDQPMFQQDGDAWEVPQDVEYDGEVHQIITRFTLAREEARNTPNAGATPHGRHAKTNVGISLIRANRELELEMSLVNGYDPRERWWGVEVEFPPALDELFGVTNNKQSARNFSDIAQAFEALMADAASIAELKSQMKDDEDPSAPLIDVIHLVDRRLTALRKLLQIQTKGTRRSTRHPEHSAEERGTEVTQERQKEGHRGSSDDDESLPPDERAAALSKELEESGLGPEQAREMAARTIADGLKYTFAEADLEGRAFFTVRPVAGEIVIKLNVNHPAYKNLVEVLEEDGLDGDVANGVLVDRLNRASRGLKLLLMAWARFEDEAMPQRRKEEVQDLRTEWGRYAAAFLQDDR